MIGAPNWPSSMRFTLACSSIDADGKPSISSAVADVVIIARSANGEVVGIARCVGRVLEQVDILVPTSSNGGGEK